MLPKLYEYKELRLWERETISIYPLCLQNIRRWKIWSRVSKKKKAAAIRIYLEVLLLILLKQLSKY